MMQILKQKNKNWIALASILIAINIAIGAFAAHGLKSIASTIQINSILTGVLYLYLHAIAILWLSVVAVFVEDKKVVWAIKLFFLGIFLFCFSIYIMNFLSIFFSTLEGLKIFFAFLTPLGGLVFIVAWLLLATIFIKKQQ